MGRRSSEGKKDQRPRLRTAALLGILFGLLSCAVLALSLTLLGTIPRS
ncbi:hypothetical protein HRbin28_00628 [bacterium HR28]|nr:hypothetical protein HRbin28_00628 [bacterium HR28]